MFNDKNVRIAKFEAKDKKPKDDEEDEDEKTIQSRSRSPGTRESTALPGTYIIKVGS